MPRRTGLGVLAVAASAALIAGCGATSSRGTNDSSAPPKTELTSAFQSLGDASALTTTIALDTTAANLLKLDREGGGSGLTPTQAALIAGTHIVIEATAPDGKTLHDEAAAGTISKDALSVTATSGSTTYLSVTVVDKTIYLQLDLKDLLSAVGKSSEYQTLLAGTASMPAFVKDLIAGKVVSVSFSTVSQLEALLKGASQGGALGSIPNGAQITKLLESIQRAVVSDLTVTRTSTGTTDQLVVTGNARSIVRDIVSTISTTFPALASQVSPSAADQAPNQDLRVDASVTGGAVSKLSFDIGQFSPRQKDTLPIVATFAKSGPDITAPSGATEVSFQDLISFFTALETATSSSSSGGGSIHVHTHVSEPPSK